MERNVRRALTVLAVSIGVSLGGAAIATATPGDPPQSGDPRATAVAGNVTTCAGAGIAGTAMDVTANITGNTYIDVTAVPAGYELTGVVVKGGPAYNKYVGLGGLPWNDLHAPLVSSGKPAEISHWFACVKKKTTTTTTTTTKTTTTTTTTTKPGSSASTGAFQPTKTSSGAVDQASNENELAETGFNGGILVLVGGLLLVGGAAALFLARARRRS